MGLSGGISLKKSLALPFIGYTFFIMLLFWGICLFFTQFGATLDKHFLLYIPFLLGGWSPAIASYLVMKQYRRVTDFKSWLKLMFTAQQPLKRYLLIAFLALLYYLPQLLFSGLKLTYPFYMIFIFTPLLLIGGGLSETGWRYILQPELDKKIGFVLSAVVTAIIWAIWHLPLFFISGTELYDLNFSLYFVNLLSLSFAFGAVQRISKNVFLCMVFHCLINAVATVFIIKLTAWGTLIAASLLIFVSLHLVQNKKTKPIKRRRARART